MSRYRFIPHRHSREEQIDMIWKQLKCHPNCMETNDTWNSLKDKPFSDYWVSKLFGSWRKAKIYFKQDIVLDSKIDLTEEIIFNTFRNRLKIDKHCLDSEEHWDVYTWEKHGGKRPFSILTACRRLNTTTNKIKAELGLDLCKNISHTKEEIIDGIIEHKTLYPNCIRSIEDWAKSNPPFSASAIIKAFSDEGKHNGWNRMKQYFAETANSYRWTPVVEIKKYVSEILAKNPNCLDNQNLWKEHNPLYSFGKVIKVYGGTTFAKADNNILISAGHSAKVLCAVIKNEDIKKKVIRLLYEIFDLSPSQTNIDVLNAFNRHMHDKYTNEQRAIARKYLNFLLNHNKEKHNEEVKLSA